MKDKLIEKLNIGDEHAFEEIMWKYASYVCAVVRNHSSGLLTAEDIEEIASDTFAALWLNREKLDAGRPFMPYLAVTARNKTLNRLRTVHITAGIGEAADIPGTDGLGELEKAAVADILEAAEKIGGSSREVFIRHCMYGEPIERIAAEMKLKPANVRTKLFRAKERIRKILWKRGYFNEK